MSFATEEDSTGSGNARRTPMLVVLWATDNDELAQGLAQRLVAGKDTVLVSVRQCWSRRGLPKPQAGEALPQPQAGEPWESPERALEEPLESPRRALGEPFLSSCESPP